VGVTYHEALNLIAGVIKTVNFYGSM
jgi:hypothetical protein